jgi:hemoglobin
MVSVFIRGLSIAVAMIVCGLTAPRAQAANDDLYQALGGQATIVKFVDDATNLWVADERIKDTFDNINLVRFKQRLSDQICALSGGPCKYTGRDMAESHKGLHIKVAEFNALVEGLQQAMGNAGVSFRTQNKLLTLLAPMERDIVTR